MIPKNFFGELRRRNVVRVATTYAVVAWLLVQAASIMLPTFDAPGWVMKALLLILALGFIGVVFISWAFEATPEGLKRTEDVPPDVAAKLPTWSRPKFAAFVIGVAGIAAALLAYQIWRHARSTSSSAATELPNKSIAVLPFDNLSRDPDNAFFAEGVQDEILTRLAKVADLKVIARSSTQKFKSSPENLPDIAKQLGALNILEGSVQKAGDQVRVNVQLVNALTNAHLWAETYDRRLIDIFSVESEIAKTIADTLQAKLTGSEKTAIAKKPTQNPAAHELYLQGRFFWNKRNAANLRKSLDYFNKAIALDPNYALAYAGIAQAWAILPAYDGGSPAECAPQAEAAARKALSLDETSSDALAVLASAKAEYDFDIPNARVQYERVFQLNPNDATAHHWFATDCLQPVGDYTGELAEMKRAAELDPLSPVITTNLGNAYLHNGQVDEAIAHYQKAIDLDPNLYFAQWCYGQALMLQGKIPDAIAQYEKAAAMTDDPLPLGMLGLVYGTHGRRDEAQKILARLREARVKRFTPAFALALVCIGLGDHDQAINWLEESYREHDGNNMCAIRIDPALAPLHGDARFEALAEKIVPARLFTPKSK